MQAAGYPAMNTAAPAAPRRSFEWKGVVVRLCVALTVYIAVVPLGFLFWQSFFTPQTAAKAAEFTLDNYTSAYGSSETPRLFCNSPQFASRAALFPLPLALRLERDSPALLELAQVRLRRVAVRLRRGHCARVDERAHQHALQGAIFRLVDHPAYHPRHPLHGRVDPARQSQDRNHQPRAARLVRAGEALVQRLLAVGDDLGRRTALLADGVSPHDRRFPRDGPGARGVRDHER